VLASFSSAQKLVQEQGTDACKELADATEKAVEDNVAAEQDLLNKIDKGASCPDSGQEAVKAAKKAKEDADKAVTDAETAHNSALNAEVDWGKSTFSSVTKGNCAGFFGSSAWTEAEAKVNAAKDALDKAKGSAKTAADEVTTMEEAAKEAVKKCKCDAYTAHEAALKASNEKITTANKDAWTKAAHLKCVVAGTALDKCTVPPLPAVKAVTLSEGVDNSACVQDHEVAKSVDATLAGSAKGCTHGALNKKAPKLLGEASFSQNAQTSAKQNELGDSACAKFGAGAYSASWDQFQKFAGSSPGYTTIPSNDPYGGHLVPACCSAGCHKYHSNTHKRICYTSGQNLKQAGEQKGYGCWSGTRKVMCVKNVE